jgi:hypothetical protein
MKNAWRKRMINRSLRTLNLLDEPANTRFSCMIGTNVTEAKPEEKPAATKKPEQPKLPPEIGGPKGPEPTRYGDWERNGRCTDF